MRFLRMFCAAVLLTGVAAAPVNEIRTALQTGHPVVLVVQGAAQAESSEAYGDWASYLNQFAGRAGSSVNIVKLSLQRYSELVSKPKLKGAYNTLFLRDGSRGLLYRGMILEPDVYRIGQAYMTGKPGDPPVAREGLEEVAMQVRR